MAKKTAMQNLLDWISGVTNERGYRPPFISEIIMKAIELRDNEEWKQLMNARLDGFRISCEGWNGEYPFEIDDSILSKDIENEQWYNETYGTDE